ncbi:MAG TPA: ABC transporter ATP-binding protein [Burkholderiaceae bacterium]|nr:ABC transporter ATP-binding protein [Burkholderiaceae bacterium]
MRLMLEKVGLKVGAEQYLYDIDLALEPGSVNVLLGPTLAGKTSLLRLLAGLDRPTSGHVRIDGRDVTGQGVRTRNVAMVYQQFINYPSMTVFDNIASPLRQAKQLDRQEIEHKVRATAKLLHLEQLLDRLPAQLSGGQQQRTAIARALVKDADLLLLDEPLVNLDYKLREELRAEMRGLFADRGITVVYATTEPQEALLLGGTTIVMDEGRVLQAGPALHVYHRPASRRVAEVFSDPPMNIFPIRLDGEMCRTSIGAAFARAEHMRGNATGEYLAGVRADHVRINGAAATATPGNGGKAALSAVVELAEISGSETFVHASHGDLTLTARLDGVHNYQLGQQVVLNFDPARVFLFDRAGALAAAPSSSPKTAGTNLPSPASAGEGSGVRGETRAAVLGPRAGA